MHVHLIGVCGTGMGSLAGLLKRMGHRVTGSDTAFYPPMGDALKAWQVEITEGYRAEHVADSPDWVVVGNVCRSDNVEAQAALHAGLRCVSLPEALETLLLKDRKNFVVAGTHGKTTTTALVAYLLQTTGFRPGYLVGGIPFDLEESFALGIPSAPFVIEGDEYDSAFFEKKPKFWRYRPWGAILTSLEYDHIDIYPSMDAYRHAFVEFVRRIPEDGLLVAYAGDKEVRAVLSEARCRIRTYALSGDDCQGLDPQWSAAPVQSADSTQALDLFAGGSYCGRLATPLAGKHNLRNIVAALALVSEGAGVAIQTLAPKLPHFRGVKRRLELRGTLQHIHVYDDFAHHPTAVRETLEGTKAKHPQSRLVAMFEPRSSTSCRNLHQEEYAHAFDAAEVIYVAQLGRSNIAAHEQLDIHALVSALQRAGKKAYGPLDADAMVEHVLEHTQPNDTLVMMSNGAFGQIPSRLLAKLQTRFPQP